MSSTLPKIALGFRIPIHTLEAIASAETIEEFETLSVGSSLADPSAKLVAPHLHDERAREYCRVRSSPL